MQKYYGNIAGPQADPYYQGNATVGGGINARKGLLDFRILIAIVSLAIGLILVIAQIFRKRSSSSEEEDKKLPGNELSYDPSMRE